MFPKVKKQPMSGALPVDLLQLSEELYGSRGLCRPKWRCHVSALRHISSTGSRAYKPPFCEFLFLKIPEKFLKNQNKI